jgi:hypothetical protein
MMMNHDATDNPPIPPTFQYKKVLAAEKPVHEKHDRFSAKHPAMPLSRRAKIFSPFDALKGFQETIADKDIPYTKKQELPGEETLS